MSYETDLAKPPTESLDTPEAYPTVPVTLFEFDEMGELKSTSTRDLSVVGQLDHGKHFDTTAQEFKGVLTDNPALLLSIYEDGPLGLDKPEFDGGASVTAIDQQNGKVTFSQRYNSLAYRYGSITLSPDHTFVIDFSRTKLEIGVGTEQPETALVPATIQFGADNTIGSINENNDIGINFRNQKTYLEIPAIRAMYDALGYHAVNSKFSKAESVQLPTPEEFKRRMTAMREADPNIPAIELVKAGAIDPEEYVRILADGKFPVSANNFYYYLHDMAAEHLLALFKYGEPLTDFMSQYAAAVRDVGTLHFSKFYDGDRTPEGDFEGTTKFERAAGLLDTITSSLQSLSIDRVTEEQARDGLLKPTMIDMVDTLRTNHTLGQTEVVKSLLRRGVVASEDEITSSMVVDEFVQLARERLDITVKPPIERVDYFNDSIL